MPPNNFKMTSYWCTLVVYIICLKPLDIYPSRHFFRNVSLGQSSPQVYRQPFFVFFPQMAHNTQTYDSYIQAYSASIFGWKCLICSVEAKDQDGIEMQHIGSGTTIYTDSIDGTKWLCCATCRCKFHLTCVTVGTKESETQINSRGSFICTFNGCRK